MKRLLALVFCITSFAFSQSSTVSGTHVIDNTGALVAAGKWCFGPNCLNVLNGVVSGSVPQGTANLTVGDKAGNPYYTISSVVISGSSFAWDAFTLGTGQSASGNGNPVLPCMAGATYKNTYDSAPWQCLSVGGSPIWVLLPSLKPAAPGTYSGVGIPSFYCTAPCLYLQADASPAGAATYATVAVPGVVTNTWTQQAGGSSVAGLSSDGVTLLFSGTGGAVAKSFATSDTLNNYQIAFTAGSGGDATCVLSAAGGVTQCLKAGVIQCSVSTAAFSQASCGPSTTFVTLTDGATVAWAAGASGNSALAMNHTTATRAINVSGLVSGGSYVLALKQDATGGAAATLGTGCTWYQGGATGYTALTTLTLTTTANAINILAFTYDGTNCYANLR